VKRPAHSILFNLDPESAHRLTLTALRVAGGIAPARWLLRLLYYTPSKPVTAFGVTFRNPVGLAAGYDKDAVAVRGLAVLGFGHIEVGTITPLPQEGNPRPRLFRLVEDEAIINRMGFPSRGSAYLQKQLSPGPRGNWINDMLGIRSRAPSASNPRALRLTAGSKIGVNLGRNRDTPNEQAVLDYLELLQTVGQHADYVTINVSSPNTAGLRDLQSAAALEALLSQLHAQRRMEQERIKRRLPLLVKLAPDLTESELDEAVDIIVRTRMDGIIVTNTTTARGELASAERDEQGGLSGAPLAARSEQVLKSVVRRLAGTLPVVSAGGIMSPDDARRRLDLGAALIQVYTGLVYRGPGLVRSIVRAL
jgi:dihydroorotate dehydrogenase